MIPAFLSGRENATPVRSEPHIMADQRATSSCNKRGETILMSQTCTTPTYHRITIKFTSLIFKITLSRTIKLQILIKAQKRAVYFNQLTHYFLKLSSINVIEPVYYWTHLINKTVWGLCFNSSTQYFVPFSCELPSATWFSLWLIFN